MYAPLKNIHILDFSRLLPGPFCSHLLSELGAKVTVVEAPFLEKILEFPNLQKNKKQISLNLKEKKSFQKIEKLIQKSEVLLEGFRPGVMQRLGLSFDRVQKINPEILYCSISGYGSEPGQKEEARAGHDLNFLAESGFLSDLYLNKDPQVPGLPLGDLIAGQQAAFQIVSALHEVKSKKKALHLNLSIYESVQKFLHPFEGVKQAVAPLFSEGLARYQVYKTADKKFLVVAALEEKFWQALIQHLKIPQQLLDSGESAIKNHLKKLFLLHPLAFWLKELAHPDFCVSEVKKYPS
ncbi:MAG: CoA transferase [Deltaproteobacteria bacterium]|nr:CoA transferase [Deltaproteobacteria bacterium]